MRTTLWATALLMTAATTALQAQTPRDTFVIAGAIEDIVSLDPHEAFEFTSGQLMTQWYDKLVGSDPRTDIVPIQPNLAESWTVSPDGKTFTFKIRGDRKFHSGNPVTARDVEYSYHRIVHLNKSPAFIITQFGLTKENVAERAKALDDNTFVLTTDQAYASSFVLNCLRAAVGSIVDSKLVKANEKDGDWGNTWLKTNEAGSGPFRLGAWKPNEQVSFERYAEYPDNAAGVRRVIIRHMPEGATQRLALEKGDVDMARNLTADQIAVLDRNLKIVINTYPRSYLWYFSANQKHEILRKPEVIEAMRYLVDYDGMVNSVLARQFVVHQTYVPQGFLGAITDKPYMFDLAKAKALLAKAGHPDGFKISMDVTNTFPSTAMAQAIQANFAKAGIQLEIIPGDFRATITKYRARNHELYIGRWGSDFLDPHSNADTFAKNEDNGDNPPAKPLAWRNAWQDAALTAATKAAMVESDTAKRQALYESTQRQFLASHNPFVIMFQSAEVTASRGYVRGYYTGPLSETTWFRYVEK